MRVAVDRDQCCAAGQCVLAAPEVFRQRDSDGTSYPVTAHPDPGLREALLEAVAACPTQAVTLHE
ncbi:ferredoxin [Streptomyces sp. NPDC052051]|uniref:ferredoxin n=1 Tax=Streptomyces sp. NPDC052051 TaxID=3154649 RepID=UPI00341744EA